MAVQQSTRSGLVLDSPILRAILIVVAVVAVMLVATVIFGVAQLGPSYQIVPDPAAGMALPF